MQGHEGEEEGGNQSHEGVEELGDQSQDEGGHLIVYVICMSTIHVKSMLTKFTWCISRYFFFSELFYRFSHFHKCSASGIISIVSHLLL